jgi:NAD(P)H-hydrate epimerase
VDVVIDGLYGLGFQPPLRPEAAALLKQVNARTDIDFRVSIDLPSGLDAASADPDTFVADFTYIPGVAKKPCFEISNSAHVGRVRFLELDVFSGQPEEGHEWFVASPNAFKRINRIRPTASDKRSYGHVLVVAGSSRLPGAAVMATKGALQAGAGLVTTFTPGRLFHYLIGSAPEAMWAQLPLKTDGTLDPEAVRVVSQFTDKASGLLIGPGLMMDRSSSFTICRIVRENPLPLVLDASALTQDVMAAVLGRPLNAGPVVLTPHRGEYARILGLKEDPHDAAGFMAFCRKYRAITVLKGHPTLVCDGERIISVPTGGPVLARGGSGDILAGMLLTQLAQNPERPLEAVLATVSWHGTAGDSLARQCGSIAVKTTDLLPHLSRALRS